MGLKFDVDRLNNDESFADLKKTMGITYQDSIEVSPKAFPNYEDKVSVWIIHHFHNHHSLSVFTALTR